MHCTWIPDSLQSKFVSLMRSFIAVITCVKATGEAKVNFRTMALKRREERKSA